MCCEDTAVPGHLYCVVHKATVDVITRQLKHQSEDEKEWVLAAKKMRNVMGKRSGSSWFSE